MNATHVDRLVGNRLKSIRLSHSVPLADLAKSAQLSIDDYSRSEAGNRRFRAIELFRIAQKLDVGMADILTVLDSSSASVVDQNC